MPGEHHESDGIPEAIEDLMRGAMLLGTRLAERRARGREQALRNAASHSLQDAHAERDRQRAQRERALLQLEGVFSGAWWEHASAEEIRHAWTTARSYQHEDARAARGVWRIADELKDRYNLDPFQIDPEAFGTRVELEPRTPITNQELARHDRELARLRAALDAAERVPHDGLAEEHLLQQRAEIDEIRDLIARQRGATISQTPGQRRSRELREVGEVAVAISGAEDPAAPGYDTRDRRALLAERLAALDLDADAVRAAVLADAANPQPPEMAAATEPQPAPRARVSSQARRGRRQARRPR